MKDENLFENIWDADNSALIPDQRNTCSFQKQGSKQILKPQTGTNFIRRGSVEFLKDNLLVRPAERFFATIKILPSSLKLSQGTLKESIQNFTGKDFPFLQERQTQFG